MSTAGATIDTSIAHEMVLTRDKIADANHSRIDAWSEEVLILISSDMTHYETEVAATERDREAIERLEALDPDGLLETCRRLNVSMCGLGPAMAALEAVRILGCEGGHLLHYTTSAEASGDASRVVGYAGMIFH